MAINKLTSPVSPAVSATDWASIVSLVEKLFLGTELPVRIDYDNNLVLKGSVFQIGGSVYLADADTAITGTPSDYVQIAPSGSTASAAYVANLTGVTWNSTYKGYYDGSGNLYVFDEDKALYSGEISVVYNSIGKIAKNSSYNSKPGEISIMLTEFETTTVPAIAAGGLCEINGVRYRNSADISISGSTSNSTWYEIALTPSGSTYTASFVALGSGSYDENKQGIYDGSGNRIIGMVYRNSSGQFINKNVLKIKNRMIKISLKIGSWDMNATNAVVVTTLNSTIANAAVDMTAVIYRDDNSFKYPISYNSNGWVYVNVPGSQIVAERLTSGNFDNTLYDDTSINRGFVYFTYKV